MKAVTFFAFLNESYKEQVRELKSWQPVLASGHWDADGQQELIDSYDEFLGEDDFDPNDYSGIQALKEVL